MRFNVNKGIKAVFGAVACAVVFAAPAAAQLQFGAAAGVNLASIGGDDFEDADGRTAPFFEAQLVWHPVGSTFGFQTGAVWSPKGASEEESGLEGTLKLDYVDVPLLLRFALPTSSSFSPVFLVGGTASFKSDCSVELEADGDSLATDCGDDIEVKSFDFGLTGGAALDVTVADGMVLSPFVRYTHGLTEIDDSAEGSDAKNKVFQVGAAFRIAL
jgi:hypothetical protein